MGADFIGYCVFGPWKLTESKAVWKKAERSVLEMATTAVEAKKLEKKSDDESLERLALILSDLNYDYASDFAWAQGYLKEPRKLIEELMDVWHNGSRDSSYRHVPGDKKRKVWWCGDMSWGEEPDGFGYRTLKRAEECGLWHLFGLE